MCSFKIFDDQDSAGPGLGLTVAHPHFHRPVQRKQDFQAFVPGEAWGPVPVAKVEKSNDEGKLAIEWFIVAAGRVEFDPVQFEWEPIGHLKQSWRGG